MTFVTPLVKGRAACRGVPVGRGGGECPPYECHTGSPNWLPGIHRSRERDRASGLNGGKGGKVWPSTNGQRLTFFSLCMWECVCVTVCVCSCHHQRFVSRLRCLFVCLSPTVVPLRPSLSPLYAPPSLPPLDQHPKLTSPSPHSNSFFPTPLATFTKMHLNFDSSQGHWEKFVINLHDFKIY